MHPQQQCSFDIFSPFLIKKRTKNTQENDQELTLNKKPRKLEEKKSETLEAKAMLIN